MAVAPPLRRLDLDTATQYVGETVDKPAAATNLAVLSADQCRGVFPPDTVVAVLDSDPETLSKGAAAQHWSGRWHHTEGVAWRRLREHNGQRGILCRRPLLPLAGNSVPTAV